MFMVKVDYHFLFHSFVVLKDVVEIYGERKVFFVRGRFNIFSLYLLLFFLFSFFGERIERWKSKRKSWKMLCVPSYKVVRFFLYVLFSMFFDSGHNSKGTGRRCKSLTEESSRVFLLSDCCCWEFVYKNITLQWKTC